jgi:hypothetical protein
MDVLNRLCKQMKKKTNNICKNLAPSHMQQASSIQRVTSSSFNVSFLITLHFPH